LPRAISLYKLKPWYPLLLPITATVLSGKSWPQDALGALFAISIRDIKTEIINTTKQIGDLVGWLILRHSPPELYQPTMYIDLEGVNLCREGSLSILTLLIDIGIPTIRVYLIDIYSLGSQAFNTTSIKGKTLKDIF
jgi:hypothetical protein